MNEKESQNEVSAQPAVRSTAWLDAFERALAEEGHFYQTTMEDGYCVKLMRGPRFCGPRISDVLEQLAQHYGI